MQSSRPSNKGEGGCGHPDLQIRGRGRGGCNHPGPRHKRGEAGLQKIFFGLFELSSFHSA